MDVNNAKEVTALGGLMLEMMNFEVTHSKEKLSEVLGTKYFFKKDNEWLIGIAEIKKLDYKGLTELTNKLTLLVPTLN
jgi:hypothetical protein